MEVSYKNDNLDIDFMWYSLVCSAIAIKSMPGTIF